MDVGIGLPNAVPGMSGGRLVEWVRRYVAEFDAAGCDELILVPSSSDPDQVDLLADAVGL